MKILLTGAAYQGKTGYAAAAYGFSEDEVWDAGGNTDLQNRCVIRNLHLLVRSLMEQNADAQAVILRQLAGREDWIVICDEIGSGVVPVDKTDRQWREEVGRLCCVLAQQADIVERITCGIAQRIKG